MFYRSKTYTLSAKVTTTLIPWAAHEPPVRGLNTAQPNANLAIYPDRVSPAALARWSSR